MQPPHQPPMNGQHGPPPTQSSVAPPPPQQQQAPPTPYYQQLPPPQYYQPGAPQAWGQQQQYAPPPQQYAPPPQQYAPPPQQYAPPPQQYAPPPPQQYAPPPQQYAPPPPQQYAPPPPQQYAPPQYGTAPGSDEIRSLWIGDLQYWMDESYLYNAFAHVAQQIASMKIIRNKQSGHSEGYGFIEFHSRAAAEHTLMNFNGRMMPNVDQAFKLNWASASAGDKRGDNGSDHTIFVGDLAADVTDSMLEEVFKASYPSVRGAKVVTDRLTGCSKGYGFVRFGDLNEQTRAMTDMNGMMLSTRQMRIGPAANKKSMDAQQTYATNGAYQSSHGNYSENDPNNTTVFVGGLDSNVNEEYLRQVFTPYGEIGYVKIPVGKRCGFVQFTSRSSAEEAIRMLNGSQIGGQSVRLSWGRSPQNKQAPQQDANQVNGNNYYGYQQGYEGYGYSAPSAQDPSMQNYYGYPGNGYEQQQQQQQQQPPAQEQQQPPQQPPQQ
ncbi:RNA-binding protein L-like [Phragmites australis]|uniref:RNA-binding protein L-like n=1 Tax=Phragmites australis TaxID=29695 RepID=UPI002D7781D6|nr:RNA-binding protein L-like [Phragmites australis]